jgi:hypothetical protein
MTGMLALGIWMLIGAVTHHEHRLDPSFAQSLPPIVARTVEASFPFFLGLLFSGVAAGVLFLFYKALPYMFPYECRFRPKGASWALQRKLWFLHSTWIGLQNDWMLSCCPEYMRGEWGYCIFIRSGRRLLRLASSGAYAPTKIQARDDAVRDMTVLAECFGVASEFRKWEKE